MRHLQACDGLAGSGGFRCACKPGVARGRQIAPRSDSGPMKTFGRRLEQAPPDEIVAQPRPVAAVTVERRSPMSPMRLRLRTKIMEQLDSAAVADMTSAVLRAELEPV